MTDHLPLLAEDDPYGPRQVGEAPGLGALTCPSGPLPLKSLEVRARIQGLLVHTVVTQGFVNTHGEAIEATYIFPLPDRAAVRSFQVEVAGRVIVGMLEERSKARDRYEKALREGRHAAIAEEDRANVFTLRVGNLLPGERAVARLEMSGPVSVDSGEATFRFPLVVAPRYIPGAPCGGVAAGDGVEPDTDAVPDASRISPPVLLPGFPNPVTLSLSVELDGAGLDFSDLRSSLHTVVEERAAGIRRLTLTPGERLDRDFILRFRVGETAVGASLVATLDPQGDEGTVSLTLVPSAGGAAGGAPRDVVFVLDRSGSMQGWKIVAARRALARMIDTLGTRDRFTVVAFDDVVETPSPGGEGGLLEASDLERFRAIEWLSGIDSRSGTEILEPLRRACEALTVVARDRVLVLLTDGQVGNEDQILHDLSPLLSGIRIFALGIDRAVNEAFLRRLATLGGGVFEVVESESRLDEVMARVHRRLGAPVLRDLRLQADGLSLDADTLVPRRLPDLFPGAPLVVTGRFRGPARGSLTVFASDEAGIPWSRTLPVTPGGDPAIASVWARGRVRELEDRYAVGGSQADPAALEKEIVATSLRFAVLSRFTAYVAVDPREPASPIPQMHRILQPVELPSGWATALGQTFPSRGVMTATHFTRPPEADGASCSSLGWGTEPLRLEPVDLTAYRARAADLLADLVRADGTPPEQRRRALAALAVRLAELVEDLVSVGADEAKRQPLAKLAAELRWFVEAGGADEARLVHLDRNARNTLADFIAADGPALRRKFPWFWK